ncbi:MAG: hypothetical protein K2Z81_09535 [Cyanobacteria bacterium]|nr:hypothetical protein [Cyanobacteriota bacterium]
MYPIKRIVMVFLSTLFALQCTAAHAEAFETKSPTRVPNLRESAAVTFSTLPLPPNGERLKVEPTTVELYQHDEEPIGNRKPLLFVHGLNGECKEGFRWDRVVEEFLKDPQFRDSYKIYYARFDTFSLLSTTKPLFKKAIADLHSYTGNRQLTIMALSLGGALVHQAMEDPDIDRTVERVFALGTPFHGSPLFCYDWMRYGIAKGHKLPWVRTDLCLTYKLYFKQHPNMLADLRWDNSDQGIPNVGKFRIGLPLQVKGTVTRERMDNPRIFKLNTESKIDKNKFVCYGGYLLTPFVVPHKYTAWRKVVGWPWWFVTNQVPFHMAFEHPVLRALNYEMGKLVVADESGKPVVDSSRYSLNDGITPLVSAIYLPSKVLHDRPVNREPDIKTIRDAIDVKRARVFRQIDHITFIDGYRPEGSGPPEIRDELAPDQSPRTVFEWMLTDLLDRDETVVKTDSALEAKKPDSSAIE